MNTTTPAVWEELSAALEVATPKLSAITEEVAARRTAPGKWSCKQVIGHLIDSASNNHGRFVRAQLQDELVFPGYDQDAWVRAQRYDDRPWRDLVSLWRELNLQVAHVMRSMPASERTRPRARHNFHDIAWKTVPPSEPTTLEYFLRDYVGHMQHHLRQAFDVARAVT